MTINTWLINKVILLACIFTFISSMNVYAGAIDKKTITDTKIDRIHIVSQSWEKYTNIDGSGLFLDITRAIYEPHGISLHIEYQPYKRALYRLKDQTADAMYGTYSVEKEGKDYLITPKFPIDKEKTVAIYKPGKTFKWQGPASLENHTLAWVRGYDYHENLPFKVENFSEVTDSNQGLDMLKVGRFEFFLDHSGELNDTIKRTGFDTDGYQTNTVLEENIYMAFAKTTKGEQLAKLYDKGFKQLIHNGKMKAIFAKYDIDFPFTTDNNLSDMTP